MAYGSPSSALSDFTSRGASYETAPQGVDKNIKKELERHRHTGISISEFLRLSFFLSDAQTQEYADLVHGVHAHTSNDYQVVRDEFAQKVSRDERDLYRPFAKMVNLILDQHQHHTAHRIKALPFSGYAPVDFRRSEESQLGVLLVPQKDGDTEITVNNVRWCQTLLLTEFKEGLRAKKRSVQEVGPMDSPLPSIRLCTDSTKTAVAQPTSAQPNDYELDTSSPARGGLASSSRHNESEAASSDRRPSHPARLSRLPGSVVPEHRQVSQHMVRSPTCSTATEAANTRDVPMPPVGEEDNHSIVRCAQDTSSHSPPPQTLAITTHTASESDIRWEAHLAGYVAKVMSDLSDLYVISDEFDLIDDPVTFSIILLLFAKEPLEKLGFSSDMGYRDHFNPRPERVMHVELNAIERGGDNFTLEPGTQLVLKKCIHSEYCLTGRATSVYDVVRPKNCEVDLVVKFSWQVKQRRREDIAIRIARYVETEHSPEIYGVGIASEKSPSKSLIEKCSVRPPSPTEERELRVLLMRKYRPVEELDSDQYYDVAQQLVLYVHRLYSKAELLHRDISIFNMAYYMKGEDIIGVLIDFDLAIYPIEMACLVLGITPAGESDRNDNDSSASNEAPTNVTTIVNTAGNSGVNTLLNIYPLGGCQDRSGTTPFMAVETLDLSTPGYKHHLCHDLESILYASVWHGVGYKYAEKKYPKVVIDTPDGPKETDLLRPWRVGSWGNVVKEKVAFLERPRVITKSIDCRLLATTCEKLARQFHTRRAVVLEASQMREEMEGEFAALKEYMANGNGHKKQSANKNKEMLELWRENNAEAQLRSVVLEPLSPIFPQYAYNWLIRCNLDDCQKSCCRI